MVESPEPELSRRSRRLSTAGLVAVTALPFVVHASFIVARRSWAGRSSTDISLTEIAVRHAGTGRQLLGPYSRFEFHHPGPIAFYSLWPFHRILGEGPAGLYLGALALGLVAAVGAVLIVRRVGGSPAAVTMCAAILLLYGLDTHLMVFPWNPLYIVLPMTVFLVSIAAAVSHSPWYLVPACVAATFITQSHLGPAPTVVVLAVSGVVFVVVRWRRSGRGPLLATLGVGVVLWSPAIYEQLTRDPGNLDVLLDSMSDGSDRITVRAAASLFVRGTTSFPLGLGGLGEMVGRPSIVRMIVLLLFGVLLVAATIIGIRRDRRFEVALTGGAALALLVSFVSILAVRGGPLAYLSYWIAGLALVGWVGIVLIAVDLAAPRWSQVDRKIVRTASAALLIGSSLTVTYLAVRHSDSEPWDFEDTGDNALIADDVRGFLRDQGLREVEVDPTQSTWGPSAAIVNALDADGIRVTVSEEWVFMYDPRFAPTGRPTVQLLVLDNTPANAPGSADETVSSRSVLVLASGVPRG